MNRLRLGLIFGGRSSEHEVSLRSARSIYEALDRTRYDVVLIGIDPAGRWHLHSSAEFERLTGSPGSILLSETSREVTLPPAPNHGALMSLSSPGDPMGALDVVFPVLHGPYGEDGTVQGLLELADVAYVGAGVLGSALGMDKDVQKRILREAGIPVVDYLPLRAVEWQADPARCRTGLAPLPWPVFVKPANLGSSVGVSKVPGPRELDAAVEEAFRYDDKILVERGVDAREIECSVLGNERPEVSVLGEVCPTKDFYSYAAKYEDEHGASFVIPAPLPPYLALHIRETAAAAFRAIECEGMARVDFFLERGTDKVYVNELNTIPGFTSISQYPKLWEASGLSYAALLDRLIELALDRQQRRRRLRTSRAPALPRETGEG